MSTTNADGLEAPHRLKWWHSPEWAAWFLVFDDGQTARKGYGPFQNDWECRMAAELHGVPFIPPQSIVSEQERMK